MPYDPNSFEDFETLYSSVTRMPEALDFAAFDAAMRRYSAEFREQRPARRVLMSIAISATGEVLDVRPVTPVLPEGVTAEVECIGPDGTRVRGAPPLSDDADIVAAAIDVCRLLSFRPAERDGVPVEFPDFRIGIEL
jgi:hypothetical protein